MSVCSYPSIHLCVYPSIWHNESLKKVKLPVMSTCKIAVLEILKKVRYRLLAFMQRLLRPLALSDVLRDTHVAGDLSVSSWAGNPRSQIHRIDPSGRMIRYSWSNVCKVFLSLVVGYHPLSDPPRELRQGRIVGLCTDSPENVPKPARNLGSM